VSNPAAPEGPKGPTGTRTEVGNSESSQRNPPHIDQNAEDAPLQDEHPSPEPVPTPGPLAQGTDKVPTTEQMRPVDAESMYDRRPAEDKDTHPVEEHPTND
jgi:hypothetical protein